MTIFRLAGPFGRRAFLSQLKARKIRVASYAKAAGSDELKSQEVKLLRNIGVSAHIDSGKTTLTERILFYTGRVEEMHEVKGKDKVGATMDFMELERQRGITIQSAATYTHWKGHNINIIDTPGHIDFTVEVERALRVLDGAILVVCAVGGVQCQTMTVDRQMRRYKVPCVTFLNKMDRLGADHYSALTQMRKRLEHNCAFVTLPVGRESQHSGVIDLIEEKMLTFNEPFGTNVVADAIPADMLAEVKERRQELIECVANADDHLGEIFLEERTPTILEIKAAIRRAVISQQFNPVFCGSALKNKGVQPLLDGVVDYLPNPTEVENFGMVENKDPSGKKTTVEKVKLDPTRTQKNPLLALAFKLEAGKFGQLTYMRVYQGCIAKGSTLLNTRTGKKIRVARLVRVHCDTMETLTEAYAGDICALFGVECASGDSFVDSAKFANMSMEPIHVPEPVIAMSIKCEDSKKADNFSKGIARFTREDPTFRMEYDEEHRESIVMGMGELHLDIYSQRLEKEYGAKVILGKPRVAFRETLQAPCEFDYLHKRQSGGQGQYGRVIGIVEPLPIEQNTELEFYDECTGTNVPKGYMPGIEKGFRTTATKGPLIGKPVSGISFTIRDGASHSVDSSEYSFFCAAEGAMKQVYENGQWQILEPVMTVEVMGPMENHGTMLHTLQTRSAIITGTDQVAGYSIIYAEAPLNEMFGYSIELRKVTRGEGEFSMEFARYCVATHKTQTELIREYQKEKGIDLKTKKRQ
ncbi:elongation factor G, mitochondrial [Lingula anatina]|uniref:Elongation factor G, mitochondrial n=1 Tax=Lingula anatina TaxID=7574 RepID=A0A1S3ISW3_LINAN|nr:elongation factor G, mitochondrial [Lingula anatina]|eukprot:XP_013401292.1 elongation factor G, mitochondrial [Lingula anatina]